MTIGTTTFIILQSFKYISHSKDNAYHTDTSQNDTKYSNQRNKKILLMTYVTSTIHSLAIMMLTFPISLLKKTNKPLAQRI